MSSMSHKRKEQHDHVRKEAANTNSNDFDTSMICIWTESYTGTPLAGIQMRQTPKHFVKNARINIVTTHLPNMIEYRLHRKVFSSTRIDFSFALPSSLGCCEKLES